MDLLIFLGLFQCYYFQKQAPILFCKMDFPLKLISPVSIPKITFKFNRN